MFRASRSLLLALGLVSLGCASSPSATPVTPEPGDNDREPPRLAPEPQAKYDRALREMAARDKAGTWTPEACDATEKLFLEADSDGRHPVARYNAGLALLRCGKTAAAKAHLTSAVERNKTILGARVRLALITYEEQGEKGIDAAIAALRQAAVEGRFSDPAALTALAMLELRRGGSAADSDGADDFERAKKNIHRALAIDDAFMPAYNQLALYYLAAARRGGAGAGVAGPSAKGRKADTKFLELAALVCSQAARKDRRFAPIHNTAGLVFMELGNTSAAAASFGEARALDPSLFEAHMNFAAVNMRFRGFEQAEGAYRAAIRLRPNDYEARLGLSLALRGQIKAPGDAKANEAFRELEAAKRIAPEQPEAYYNEAVLTQAFAEETGGDPDAPLHKAKALFGAFVAKASGARGAAGEMREGVERAKGRMADIDQILIFRRQTKEEQRRAEEATKQRNAEATANEE
jgi:Tfp pilus assembly protein PilF